MAILYYQIFLWLHFGIFGPWDPKGPKNSKFSYKKDASSRKWMALWPVFIILSKLAATILENDNWSQLSKKNLKNWEVLMKIKGIKDPYLRVISFIAECLALATFEKCSFGYSHNFMLYTANAYRDFLQYLWKRAVRITEKPLYSSKEKIVYVLGNPCNIYLC